MLQAQSVNLTSSQLTANHQLKPPRTTAPELGAGSAQLQEVLNVLVSCQPQGTPNDRCVLYGVMKSYPEVQNWNLIGTGAQRISVEHKADCLCCLYGSCDGTGGDSSSTKLPVQSFCGSPNRQSLLDQCRVSHGHGTPNLRHHVKSQSWIHHIK